MSHEATTDNPYTRGIAEFVSGLSYEAIPEEVRHRIKLLMLDSLGCALYGADLEWSRILQDTLVRRWTRRARARSGARSKKLSAPHAALVNGTAGAGLRARRRAPRRRAARGRGRAARADPDRRAAGPA